MAYLAVLCCGSGHEAHACMQHRFTVTEMYEDEQFVYTGSLICHRFLHISAFVHTQAF